MTLKEQLVEIFRKANEDLTQANVRNIFKVKSGVKELTVGDNLIVLPISDDTAYLSASDYRVSFYSALDNDGIDIAAALVITDQTATSFTVNSPRAGTLKWETYLIVPNFNMHT